MRKWRKIKSCSFLIVAFVLILSIYSAEARSLKKGEIYRPLDESGVIRVISNNELEFEEGSDIIVCSYSVDNKTVRVVCAILGSKIVNYYDIIQEGLKERKSKTIFYSKATFKTASQKHYCSAIKANLVKLARAQEYYFKRYNSYIVTGDGRKLCWEGFSPREGVVINLTGVPDRYFMAMGTHKHCPHAFISDSSKKVLQGPLAIKKASLIMEETGKKAEQEKKLAREKKEREARLAREKKEREARLAREKRQQALMEAPDLILGRWKWRKGTFAEYFEDGKWKQWNGRRYEGTWSIDGDVVSTSYSDRKRVKKHKYKILEISVEKVRLQDLTWGTIYIGKKIVQK